MCTLSYLNPFSSWKYALHYMPDHSDPGVNPRLVLQDQSTLQVFNAQRARNKIIDPTLERIKFVGLTIISPFMHVVYGMVNIIFRIIRMILFIPFWWPKESEEHYDFFTRSLDWIQDGLRVLSFLYSFVIIGALWLSAIYGICDPNGGRKLYGNLEQWFYNSAYPIRCMHPLIVYPKDKFITMNDNDGETMLKIAAIIQDQPKEQKDKFISMIANPMVSAKDHLNHLEANVPKEKKRTHF